MHNISFFQFIHNFVLIRTMSYQSCQNACSTTNNLLNFYNKWLSLPIFHHQAATSLFATITSPSLSLPYPYYLDVLFLRYPNAI